MITKKVKVTVSKNNKALWNEIRIKEMKIVFLKDKTMWNPDKLAYAHLNKS